MKVTDWRQIKNAFHSSHTLMFLEKHHPCFLYMPLQPSHFHTGHVHKSLYTKQRGGADTSYSGKIKKDVVSVRHCLGTLTHTYTSAPAPVSSGKHRHSGTRQGRTQALGSRAHFVPLLFKACDSHVIIIYTEGVIVNSVQCFEQ